MTKLGDVEIQTPSEGGFAGGERGRSIKRDLRSTIKPRKVESKIFLQIKMEMKLSSFSSFLGFCSLSISESKAHNGFSEREASRRVSSGAR